MFETILFDQFDSTISFTSESNFELNTKEDKLIFWGGGSQAAVYVYDLGTSKTMRISPKGYDCWRPIVRGDTVYCRGRHGNSPKENTYRMDMDGGNFKLAYKDKVDISFASR